MPWRRGCRRKAAAFCSHISFSEPFFEVGCSLGPCPRPLTDSSSPAGLSSLLFILLLSEWDHSSPMTSVLPYMLKIPSLQIRLFSFVLRVFSVIKRHFKLSVLKVNLTIVAPQFLLLLLYLLSLLCLLFSLIILSCPEPKNSGVIPDSSLFCAPAYGPFLMFASFNCRYISRIQNACCHYPPSLSIPVLDCESKTFLKTLVSLLSHRGTRGSNDSGQGGLDSKHTFLQREHFCLPNTWGSVRILTVIMSCVTSSIKGENNSSCP